MILLSKSIDKTQKIEWILDAFSLGAVLQYCVYRFLRSTMFVIYFSQTYKILTLVLLLVFGGARYIRLIWLKLKEKKRKEQLRFILRAGFAWVLALPFIYVGWKHDYKFLILLPVCCMCLYEMDARRVLRAYTIVIGIFFLGTILCSLSGTVRNLTYTYNGKVIGSYGIINSSDAAAYCTIILLAAWGGEKKQNTFSCISFFFTNILLVGITYYFTESRTALLCGALTGALILIDGCLGKKQNECGADKIMRWITTLSFPCLFVAILFLGITYNEDNQFLLRFNQVLSSRLKVIQQPYVTYGIHPFGTATLTLNGNGASLIHKWRNGYGYIDVAYAMLIIRYGWIAAALVTCFWVRMTKGAYKTNRRISYAMAVLAFHAISEARFLDVNYNIFLIMPFCMMPDETKTENFGRESIGYKRRMTVSAIVIVSLAVFYLLLPKALSWARTLFAIFEWNKGTKALLSLLAWVIVLALLSIMMQTMAGVFLSKSKTKSVAFISACAILGIAIYQANSIICDNIVKQEKRIEQEKDIIRFVQSESIQPVYAAEASELYQRTIGGFAEHIFSTEELGRAPQGSIFTNADIEALGITSAGGAQYFNISEWSGLYTFDKAVADSLISRGFESKPYYYGIHRYDLNDVALFNNVHVSNNGSIVLADSMRIVTENDEVDQYRGVYEVSVGIRLLNNPNNMNEICSIDIMREAGDNTLYHEVVTQSEFDGSNECNKRIVYGVIDVPMVSYAINVNEDVSVEIHKIEWKRIQ